MDIVNQKPIDGVIYTALRDSDNPTKQYIRRGDEPAIAARHKDYWNDDTKLLSLFE